MSDLITVSDSMAIATLRDVVAERPEYIYEPPSGATAGATAAMCFYVHHIDSGPVPGCLVGTVLHRLGVPLDKLAELEGCGAYVVAGMTAYMSNDARCALARAQDAQDDGATWAVALAAAENLPAGIVF